MWLALTTALAAGRCGPAWIPAGQSCGNDTCGITIAPGEAAIQPHCGWSHRSIALWAGLLPPGVVHPSVVHEAVLGFRYGSVGPVATLDGRVRLSDFVALGVDGRWSSQARLRGRVQLNLPTNSPRRHLALRLRGGWDGSWTTELGVSYLEALPWNLIAYTDWRLERAAKRISGTVSAGLIGHVGPWSATLGGSLTTFSPQTAATAGLQYSHRRWNLSLDGLWGPERSVGLRVGRWHHPDRRVE